MLDERRLFVVHNKISERLVDVERLGESKSGLLLVDQAVDDRVRISDLEIGGSIETKCTKDKLYGP